VKGVDTKASVRGSGARSSALSANPSLPDAVEDLLGALRHIQLAESSPASGVSALVEAGRRVRRTVSRTLVNDSLWATLRGATTPSKAQQLTPDIRDRARDLATDHLTAAMLRAGHTPPPPGGEIVEAVVNRIERRHEPPGWLSEEPGSIALATRVALQDLHDELDDAIREAERCIASSDDVEPGRAAAQERFDNGRARARVRDRTGVDTLRAVVSAAKTPLLFLAAGTALVVPPLITAEKPAEALGDLSVNLAATALAAGAASAWNTRAGTGAVPTAGAPTQDPADVASPATTSVALDPASDLWQRREEARVRQEEELARKLAAEADEADARARRARAQADEAEARAQKRKNGHRRGDRRP
jgi:hypothetical protein